MNISIPFLHSTRSRKEHARLATEAALQKKAKENDPARQRNLPAEKPAVSSTQFAVFLLMSRIQ